MPLPRVNISFTDGALGIPPDNTDGLIIAVFEKAVTSPPVLSNGFSNPLGEYGLMSDNVAYKITSSNQFDTLQVSNGAMNIFVQDFYAEADNGTPVWIMVMSGAAGQWFGNQEDVFVKALRDTGNTATAIFFMPSTIAGAVAYKTFVSDTDTFFSMYLESDNNPCFGVVDFQAYSLASIPDDITEGVLRVAGYVGKNSTGSSNIGAFAGRYASTPVYRNAGYVGDGAVNLKSGTPYHGSVLVSAMTDTSAINDARFNTLRTHNGKSGYYFVDGLMFGSPTSDFSTITARRTIDKAYRIAFDTMTNYLLAEIPTTASGAITAQKAKAIESDLRAVFKRLMTDKGELSIDTAVDGDIGVKVQVDTAYNVLSNSRLKLTSLQVKPFGYARFIDVPLGFIPLT